MSSSKKGVTGILQAIWSGDTWWAFFVHIGLALLLIRFVLYPLLGVIFATGFPIVAVVSGSMEHAYVPFSSLPAPEGQMIYQYCDKVNLRSSPFFIRKEFTDFSVFWQNCGDWYEQKNITAERFSKFPFLHGFNTGDIMILYGTKSDRIEVGDVIVFGSNVRADPIIHRVVATRHEETGYYFTTKGDHNAQIFSAIGEDRIHDSRYLGKAVLRIPYLGWVKIYFTKLISPFFSR